MGYDKATDTGSEPVSLPHPMPLHLETVPSGEPGQYRRIRLDTYESASAPAPPVREVP